MAGLGEAVRVVGISLWLGAWGDGLFWRNGGGIENGAEAWESRSVSKEEPGVLGEAQTVQGHSVHTLFAFVHLTCGISPG